MFSKQEFGIVNDLRSISMKNFMLSWVEHEFFFIISGSVFDRNQIEAIVYTSSINLGTIFFA